MTASACQREAGVSCGACCGVFNLDFRAAGSDPEAGEAQARARLLAERTRDFAAVRFTDAASFVAYRARREAAEKDIPRYNHEIYVCPFFGLLEESDGGANRGRAGCLAHPARTGLAHTQNFSFYGASICQAYDCRNKDQDPQQRYSRLLARCFGRMRVPESEASEIYARLMADLPLFAFLERLPGLLPALLEQALARSPEELLALFENGRRPGEAGHSPLSAFFQLALLRLATPASRRVTSFEVELQRHSDALAELRALLVDTDGANAMGDANDSSVESARELLEKLSGATSAPEAARWSSE